MKSQFQHELFSSFYLWFENKLLSDDSKAYVENQSNLFEYVDCHPKVPPSHYGYQGKFRQLVAEHSVDTPNSGIFIDSQFITGSTADIDIDYENGMVVVPVSSGSSLNIEANNTIKEINTYASEDDEVQLLLTSDFVDSSDTATTNLFSNRAKRDEKTYILPACFLRVVNSDSSPLSFGGEDDTKTRIRATVLAKDNYLIDGVLSLFRDTRDECFKIVPFEDYPYGAFNNVKSFPYSYSEYTTGYSTKTFIEKVNTAKLIDSISMDKLEKNLLIGYIDFDLSTYRYPRL